MARTLTDKAAEWLDDMPPYYYEDQFVWAVLNAVGSEFSRIEAAAQALLTYSFPSRAGTSSEIIAYKLLALWELQLGLAVESPIPLNERRNAVLAHLARRRVSSEESWFAGMSAVIGSSQWTYETVDGGIIITLPFGSDQQSAQATIQYARKITPAHLALSFDFGNGFILDYSLLDFGTF